MAPKMKHAKGERLNIRFNRKIKLEFHGNGILAILSHKVDMGNIYFCSRTNINCSKMIQIVWKASEYPLG